MDNGKTPEVIADFNLIAGLPDHWDHNRHYHDYLLSRIGGRKGLALDIGCGTGELCARLSGVCDRVIGVDVAPAMIAEARKRHARSNIDYIHTDIEAFLAADGPSFDVAISVATFHHLDMARVLSLLKARMQPNGIILILDLYTPATVSDYAISIASSVANPFLHAIKLRRLSDTIEEREAWGAHATYDDCPTMAQIRQTAKQALGNVKIKRHLLWRYSLVFENGA